MILSKIRNHLFPLGLYSRMLNSQPKGCFLIQQHELSQQSVNGHQRNDVDLGHRYDWLLSGMTLCLAAMDAGPGGVRGDSVFAVQLWRECFVMIMKNNSFHFDEDDEYFPGAKQPVVRRWRLCDDEIAIPRNASNTVVGMLYCFVPTILKGKVFRADAAHTKLPVSHLFGRRGQEAPQQEVFGQQLFFG